MQNRLVPPYAEHKTGLIAGFFGEFTFLSNFYLLDEGIWHDDLVYPSVEHAYQACKYPIDQREQFLHVSSAKAKELGSIAPGFNTKKWNKQKYDVMRGFVLQKFQKNYILKDKLLLTDGYILEERNSWGDHWWGTSVTGVGENNLGKILMDVRHVLLIEQKEYKK